MKIYLEKDGKKPLLSEGSKVGSEISLLVYQSEFPSDIVSVKFDGVWGKTRQLSYLLGGSSSSDQAGNLHF